MKAKEYQHSQENIPLSDDDWSQLGRLATNDEIEEMAMMMEKEPDGEEVDIVFDRLFNNILHDH